VDLRRIRPPDNKDVCWFATEALAIRRHAGELVRSWCPDEDVRNDKAIDLVAVYEQLTIVAEHTLVPVSAGQLADAVVANEMLEGFSERFGHGLPMPGHYTLEIDPTGAHGMPRRDQPPCLRAIEEWVRSGAMPYREDVALSPATERFGLDVRLYRRRCDPVDEGSLTWRLVHFHPRVTGEDALQNALESKCPKLAVEQQRRPGSISLLVLESHDLRTANPFALQPATIVAAAALDERLVPDVIVFVDTINQSERDWMLYLVKDGMWMARASTPSLPPRAPLLPPRLGMRSFSAPAVRIR
jgi:hypothetical protein